MLHHFGSFKAKAQNFRKQRYKATSSKILEINRAHLLKPKSLERENVIAVYKLGSNLYQKQPN